MTYIKNNKLFLATKSKTIQNNLLDVTKYIYNRLLNYEEMTKIYAHIEYENDYDYFENLFTGQIVDHYNIIFENNPMEDYKYVYELDENWDDYNYHNEELVEELSDYLKLNRSAKKLILNNINKIKLINNNGVNKNAKRITTLDWKLHCWAEYIVTNSTKSTRLHDLIIALHKINNRKFDFRCTNDVKTNEFNVFKSGSKRELIVDINNLLK